MSKEDLMPSETEWLIMECVWGREEAVTSAEIIEYVKGVKRMAPKTVRVLINRLCQKGLLSYTIDERDSRVYHYRAVRSKEECLAEKSRHFVNSYFSGNGSGAVAALLQNVELSEKELESLRDILRK